ncbi:MAG: hypothetical protein GXO23_07025 [Crenarchaeota archaeon]|nr:hypothetical protein [Thermoproteota archaeon]
MCRICTYYGEPAKDVLNELVETILKISRHDVIGVLSGIDDFHPDGWGIYIRDSERELYFRSGNAIFSEDPLLKGIVNNYVDNIPSLHNLLMILHIRAASQGEPHGAEHSHPYMIANDDIKVVLAHNGAVKKRELLKELGRENLHDRITDSMALAIYIFEKVRAGFRLSDIIRDVMDNYTKTALMTTIFLKYGEEMKLIVTSHICERSRHRINYYRLYKICNGQSAVYISSSLAHELSNYSSLFKKFSIVPLPVEKYHEIIEVRF